MSEQHIWNCRICGFGVAEGPALEFMKRGHHPNALGNDSPNKGTAYCPHCEDETLRHPSPTPATGVEAAKKRYLALRFAYINAVSGNASMNRSTQGDLMDGALDALIAAVRAEVYESPVAAALHSATLDRAEAAERTIIELRQEKGRLHALLQNAHALIDPEQHHEINDQINAEFETCQQIHDRLAATITAQDEEIAALKTRIAVLRERFMVLFSSSFEVSPQSGLRHYNCDCLNADGAGRPVDDTATEQGIYCHRWVVLAEDAALVVAERDALLATTARLREQLGAGIAGIFSGEDKSQLADAIRAWDDENEKRVEAEVERDKALAANTEQSEQIEMLSKALAIAAGATSRTCRPRGDQ